MELIRTRSFTTASSSTGRERRERKYSTSSEIIPHKLHTIKSSSADNSPNETPKSGKSTPPNVNNVPSVSEVGFQSIFHSTEVRRSRQSIISDSLTSGTGRYSQERHMGLEHSSYTTRHYDSQNEKAFSSLPRNMSTISLDQSKPGTLRSQNTSQSSGTLSKGKQSIRQAAMKLFHIRSSNRKHVENETQSSFTKYLHPQHGRHHRAYTTTNATETTKPLYSLSQSQPSNMSETSMRMMHVVAFDNHDVQMLHDLIKNMPSFESSFNQFTMQEQDALLGNIWGVYCNLILSVFKNQRIWQSPAKIEDINRVFKFYIRLKQHGKTLCFGTKFLGEIEECIRAALYVLERQVFYSHSDNPGMNSSIKRLCEIWRIFYKHVVGDTMAILAPLEVSFQVNPQYWNDDQDDKVLSLCRIMYQIFRDAVVLPYYQMFMNSQEGPKNGFQQYIADEEEKNGLTQTDKLTLLQCFGILASVNTRDVNQRAIEELLTGVRMSM